MVEYAMLSFLFKGTSVLKKHVKCSDTTVYWSKTVNYYILMNTQLWLNADKEWAPCNCNRFNSRYLLNKLEVMGYGVFFSTSLALFPNIIVYNRYIWLMWRKYQSSILFCFLQGCKAVHASKYSSVPRIHRQP